LGADRSATAFGCGNRSLFRAIVLNFFLNFATDQRADGGAHNCSDVPIAHVLADSAADDSAGCRSGDAVRVFWIGHCCDLLIPAFLLCALRGWLAEVRIGCSCPGCRNADGSAYSDPR
jgi:hypothetical protein